MKHRMPSICRMTRLPFAVLCLTALLPVVAGCKGSGEPPDTMSVNKEITLYEQHVAERPEDMAGWTGLAQRYINYAGDRAAALALADRVKRENPGLPQAFLAAAQIRLMASDDVAPVRTEIEHYVDLEPRDERGYLLLADTWREQPAEALDVLDRGINLLRGMIGAPDAKPETVVGLLRLLAARAQLLTLHHRYDEALVAVESVLDDAKMREAASDAMWELIALAVRCAMHEALKPGGDETMVNRARARLDTALAANPAQPALIREWAWLMISSDQISEATDSLAAMLSRTENPDARKAVYLYLAQCEVMRDKAGVARSHARRALEVDPVDMPTLLLLYQVMTVLNDTARGAVAERLVQQRVSLMPMPQKVSSLQSMFRGVIYQHYWLTEQASLEFQHANRAEADIPWPLLALGQLAQDDAEYSRAIAWYRQALPFEELAPEIHCNIADCYLALHDYRNAIRHYDDAMALVPGNPRARRGKLRAEEQREASPPE